jgi:carbamoyl-phosphate synthase large subunit
VPEPIVQTRLPGREFTVDCLIDRDGSLAGAVPRWRIETKAGISTKGETFASDSVLAGVQALATALALEGAANVQGFVDDAGAVSFVEINPRFSGALPLSLAAGADLVGEYLRAVTGHELRRDRLSYRAGVSMARYYQEVFAG